MLTIRLQRTGKRNRPTFRIVVAEKESHVSKKITEALGSYDPRTKEFKVKEDRVQYWLGLHTNLSATVHNLLVTKGLHKAAKVRAFTTPKKEQPAAPVPASVETPAEAAEATADMEKEVSGTEAAVEAKPENNPETPETVQP